VMGAWIAPQRETGRHATRCGTALRATFTTLQHLLVHLIRM